MSIPIDWHNNDIEDLTSSLNDLSILSCNNENADVSASNSKEVDNSTTEHNILPKVKSKIIYFNPDSESWNENLVLGRAGKSDDDDDDDDDNELFLWYDWQTKGGTIALFPASTTVWDPHHHESLTCPKQDLNLHRTWVQA